ncbi:DUF2550 family protein [Nocardioides convexus]|uniref:DUF2550 family protein n=1 Tax=Nocardioides convexus TaxID=2712224 RepID=UPI0024186FB0|nr:DUF2550 family protein [Nocardioides convexus]
MVWWEWLLDACGALLLLFVLYGAGLIVRRRLLSRNGGTFELSHRYRTDRPERGWVLGLGRYSGETLEWFRVFSLSPRPKQAWRREEAAVRRPPGASGRRAGLAVPRPPRDPLPVPAR